MTASDINREIDGRAAACRQWLEGVLRPGDAMLAGELDMKAQAAGFSLSVWLRHPELSGVIKMAGGELGHRVAWCDLPLAVIVSCREPEGAEVPVPAEAACGSEEATKAVGPVVNGHRLKTPSSCGCDKDMGDCPVCDWGLGVCRGCGAAEIELDVPCVSGEGINAKSG